MIHVFSLIKVISEGGLPTVSLLVTIGGSDDEDGLTERLTRFLGIQDDEDDSKDAIESGQDGDKTGRVEGAVASELAVKPIPGKELSLVSGECIDVVVTEIKDPERFTVSNVSATICRIGTKWCHFELGLSVMVPVNSLWSQ